MVKLKSKIVSGLWAISAGILLASTPLFSMEQVLQKESRPEEVLPAKKRTEGLGTLAVGLYVVEKAGRLVKSIVQSRPVKAAVRSPLRMGGVAAAVVLAFRRPASARTVLGHAARAAGTTARASARVARGVAFCQEKSGVALQRFGARLLKEKSLEATKKTKKVCVSQLLAGHREERVLLRLSDGALEEVFVTYSE